MTPLLEAAEEWGIAVDQPLDPPKDCFWDVNGTTLHALDWGREGKPPMICLHGVGQQAHTWDFFALSMRRHFHLRALDLRGHGDSAWAADHDYTRPTMATDLHALVEDELRLPPFVLVGLSMGGLTALTFAGRWPTLIKALVVVDIGPQILPKGVENLRQFMAAPDIFEDVETLVERAHRFNPRRPKHQLRTSLMHNLRQREDGRWTWKYDPFFRQPPTEEDLRRFHPETLWADIDAVTAPTLIVRGAESDMLSQEAADTLAAHLPHAETAIVPRAGHSVMGDNPIGFEEAVASWLKRTLTQSPVSLYDKERA
ncbi:MAG: alpha/beta hydrolase [Firmicutes bacterium]|nr:alpha/beta hydrolase [Bacillota bacterium]